MLADEAKNLLLGKCNGQWGVVLSYSFILHFLLAFFSFFCYFNFNCRLNCNLLTIGRGSGSFTGGILIGQFGTRDAFQYMGLLAVVGGIAYGLLHLAWLRKFDHNLDEMEDYMDGADNGETDKLTEPTTKEQGTSMSLERLSLMIKYNQIGSLTSLPRGSRVSVVVVVVMADGFDAISLNLPSD